MKLFQTKQVRAAINYGASGGLALHMMPPGFAKAFPGAPKALTGGQEFAHLICSDLEKLEKTARRLGVKNIVVHHLHARSQHIDLFGKPLLLAKVWCDERFIYCPGDEVIVSMPGIEFFGERGEVAARGMGKPGTPFGDKPIYRVFFAQIPKPPRHRLFLESQLKLVEFANG